MIRGFLGLARLAPAGGLLLGLVSAPALGASSTPVVAGQLTARALPGLRADVATMMMQGAPGGGLDMAVAPSLERTGATYSLGLAVEVAGESLLAQAAGSGSLRIEVELYAYVLDPGGSVVAHLARSVEIPLERWGERLSAGGLRFFEELEVPEPELEIRSLVLVPALGRFGMTVSKLSGPAASGALGGIRFDDRCSDWLPVVASATAAPSGVSARPVWRTGERVAVRVPLLAEISAQPPAVRAEFRPATGEPTGIAVVAERGRDASGGGAWLALSFTVPELDQGVYEFSARLAASESTGAPVSEVWILNESGRATTPTMADAAATAPVCAWPAVMSRARLALADAGAARGEATGSPEDPLYRRARRGYLEILSGFGSGEDLESAVGRLVEWEDATTGENFDKNLRIMTAAQVAVHRDLAAADRECLLPVFALHRHAYQRHFDRGDFSLAVHSRVVAATAVEAGRGADKGDETSPWVADALVSLAQTADRQRMFAASQGLLERAADVAPRNRAARLLLGMLYEKLGDYEAASRHLEALVTGSPADAEGWLRLATLQCRLARSQDCLGSLGRVIGQRPQPWILSVAYQTLAQELFAQERFKEGLQALGEAEVLVPGDATVALAKAYGLDRVGRPGEALALLERVEPASGDQGSSRLRYANSAAAVARAVDARLRRAVIIRRPRLALAVASALEDPA